MKLVYTTPVLSKRKIGKRIKKIREDAGLRVVQIAKALRVRRQHIYLIESGQRGITTKRLQQLSRALNVELSEILGQGGESHG